MHQSEQILSAGLGHNNLNEKQAARRNKKYSITSLDKQTFSDRCSAKPSDRKRFFLPSR